jgi:hypothetical protein
LKKSSNKENVVNQVQSVDARAIVVSAAHAGGQVCTNGTWLHRELKPETWRDGFMAKGLCQGLYMSDNRKGAFVTK